MGSHGSELPLDGDEDANLINRLRTEYLDVFAAHPSHQKQAKAANIPGLARRLAQLNPSISADFDLRKAAENLADRLVGWPSVSAFAKALNSGAQHTPRPIPQAPSGWRWRRAVAHPEGVSASDWYVASVRQEAEAKQFLSTDLDARALVRIALDDGWLTALYWFVVERGRLPSPHEETEIVAICRRTDAMAREANQISPVGERLLALRQSMHDYAARQLGLVAMEIR